MLLLENYYTNLKKKLGFVFLLSLSVQWKCILKQDLLHFNLWPNSHFGIEYPWCQPQVALGPEIRTRTRTLKPNQSKAFTLVVLSNVYLFCYCKTLYYIFACWNLGEIPREKWNRTIPTCIWNMSALWPVSIFRVTLQKK